MPKLWCCFIILDEFDEIPTLVTGARITTHLSLSSANNTIFTLRIYGINTDSLTLTCSADDTCYIDCSPHSNGCTGMNLCCSNSDTTKLTINTSIQIIIRWQQAFMMYRRVLMKS